MSTTLEAQLRWQCQSVFAAEWIQRALLGQAVELDASQKAFLALYRPTEHAEELLKSLISKKARTVLARSDARTLSDMRLEDANSSPDRSYEPSLPPGPPVLRPMPRPEDIGPGRQHELSEKDREDAYDLFDDHTPF